MVGELRHRGRLIRIMSEAVSSEEDLDEMG